MSFYTEATWCPRCRFHFGAVKRCPCCGAVLLGRHEEPKAITAPPPRSLNWRDRMDVEFQAEQAAQRARRPSEAPPR